MTPGSLSLLTAAPRPKPRGTTRLTHPHPCQCSGRPRHPSSEGPRLPDALWVTRPGSRHRASTPHTQPSRTAAVSKCARYFATKYKRSHFKNELDCLLWHSNHRKKERVGRSCIKTWSRENAVGVGVGLPSAPHRGAPSHRRGPAQQARAPAAPSISKAQPSQLCSPSPGLVYRGQVLLGVVSHVHLGYTRCLCRGLEGRDTAQPHLRCQPPRGLLSEAVGQAGRGRV